MDRASLERLTVEQLRQEAARYRLSSTGRKMELIETIIAHFEANSPVADLLGSAPGPEDDGEVAGPSRRAESPEQTDVLRQMVDTLQGVIRRQDEERAEHRRCFEEQQRQFNRLLEVLTAQRVSEVQATGSGPAAKRPDPASSGSSSRTSPSRDPGAAGMSGWSNGSAIRAFASQIPEYAGREDDNVRSWVRRVEKIALVHRASDGIMLLAASGKLTASARRWFDIQTGTAVESWIGLRDELIKMFDSKMLFYKVMQKVEARKWLPAKETFDEYAIDKLALMHRADLVEQDKIHLLISGITQPSLQGTALSVNASTIPSWRR